MTQRLKRIGRGVLRGTSSLSLAAAKMMLSESMAPFVQDALRHLQDMRDLVTELLNEIDGSACNRVEATYLAFPRVEYRGLSSEELKELLLKEAKVAVEAGSRYGSIGEGHIRVNFGTSEQILREAMNRIKRFLSSPNQ
jgi:bifunctional pyridoxal-dependent enzyme with beta-cystathionase and maltose regulon repressor activities